MDPTFQSQVDTYLHRLGHLNREGRELRESLTRDPSDRSALALMSSWQRECAATISQLSGGSKAHWLSRAYSEAFLMSDGSTEVEVINIIDRILGVIAQAAGSLSQTNLEEVIAATTRQTTPPSGRFEFVKDLQLQSNVERAYADSRLFYEQRDFPLAFVTSCSVLEAIVTDALERVESTKLPAGQPIGSVASWTLDDRLKVAEALGVISAACARLPDSARSYRDLLDENGDLRPAIAVTELEAKRVAQVLSIIIRDLSPGR